MLKKSFVYTLTLFVLTAIGGLHAHPDHEATKPSQPVTSTKTQADVKKTDDDADEDYEEDEDLDDEDDVKKDDTKASLPVKK